MLHSWWLATVDLQQRMGIVRFSRRCRSLFCLAFPCLTFVAVLFVFLSASLYKSPRIHDQQFENRFFPDDRNLPRIIVLGEDTEERSQKRKHAQVNASVQLAPEGVQGCRIPKLNINGSEIAHFFFDPEPLRCEKNEPNWAYVDENRLFRLNQAAVKRHGTITCDISYFRRISDDVIKSDSYIPIRDGDAIDKSDFSELHCTASDSARWKHLLWTIVPNATRVRELSEIAKPSDWSGLNVYFIGFDSLSQMSFRRKLPLTTKFMEEQLNAVILDGYNIVGDGTPQAFIPILTGQTETELPLTRKRFRNANYVDAVYPFVWKNFSDIGYATLFAEDVAAWGVFTYRLKGFHHQPTDHYVRPFFQEAERMFKRVRCLGSIPMHQEWFRYVSEFMHRYDEKIPKFLLAFHGVLSHNHVNLVQVADADTAAHLQALKDSGALDNSLVIVMSDHGHRFAELRNTHQGQLEERLPFFAVSLPQKFRESDRGRTAYSNLKANKARLTTPFDIYATLLDIIHWPRESELKTPGDLSKRSISLFRRVPLSRTCAQAGIEPHWCTCLNWDSAMDDEEQRNTSTMLAYAVVKTINSYTNSERKLCAPLRLVNVESSKRLVPHTSLLKYKNVKDYDGYVPDLGGTTKATFAHYQIKFRTSPGNALYEVTVQYDSVANEVSVDMTAISHVNEYGDRPHCIVDKNYYMAPYCICYDKIQESEE